MSSLQQYLAHLEVFEYEKEEKLKLGLHWCSKCKEFKKLKEFSRNKSAKFGYQHWCKSCHNESRKGNQKYQKKAKLYARKLMSYYIQKAGGKCGKCGYNKTQHSLEFHHVNKDDKEYSLSALIKSNNHSKIMLEIDKCILLCRNCHMEFESSCWTADFVKIDLGWSIRNNSITENKKEYWTECENVGYDQLFFLENEVIK